jgi:hypothetical protein
MLKRCRYQLDYIISHTPNERNKIFILLRSVGLNKTGCCTARLNRCAAPSPPRRLRARARSHQNNGFVSFALIYIIHIHANSSKLSLRRKISSLQLPHEPLK